TVFVAQHLRLRKQVAIKIIQPEYASDGEVAARFSREATAGAQFDHPNVVGIIDCGRLTDGRTYLVTEMVRGPTLREFLNEHGRMHWTLACDIGSQLSEALIAAHAVGIVHRDVNPENLLLEVRDDGSYWIKLTSFGIARMTGNALVDPSHELGSTVTRQGNILGTSGYMSPEQALGEDVTESADAYALGVVLWECINGRRLWEADTAEDALALQLHQEPAGLDGFEDGPTPEILGTLICQLLARDPRERPRLIDPVSPTLRKLAHGSDFEESLVTAIPETSGLAGVGGMPGYASAGGLPFGAEPGGTVVSDGFLLPQAPPGGSSVKAVFSQLGDVLKALWRSASTGTRVILALISLTPLILIAVVLLVGGGDGGAPADEPAEKVAKADEPEPAAEEKAEEQPAEDTPKEEDAKPTIPTDVAAAVNLLFDPDVSDKERSVGATKISEFEPDDALPAYVRASSQLVLAAKCADKQAVLRKIRELDEPKTLPVLNALDKGGRNACGKGKKKKDCYPCLREDLARTIGRFEVLAELADKSGS
ncbi:MAG: serine/threonine protein kinase, partial [Myxococcales bacterium]|nr:serine/threonine protein kinase [Myxococcales bacterium]